MIFFFLKCDLIRRFSNRQLRRYIKPRRNQKEEKRKLKREDSLSLIFFVGSFYKIVSILQS